MLEVAQARGVGRRDVDGQIVRQRSEGLDAEHIVLDPVRRVPIGADVDAHHSQPAAGRPPQEARPRPLEAVVVEAEAIDDGRVLAQAKQARPGVAVLRLRRQRPDFDEAETETQYRPWNFGVLVEPGREAERVREGETERRDRKARVGRPGGRRRDELEAKDRRAMRGFRRQALDERLEELGRSPRAPSSRRRPAETRSLLQHPLQEVEFVAQRSIACR